MNRSWKLGTVFGIDLYLHWTLHLFAGYLFVRNWSLGGSELAVPALLLFAGAFGCIALHELGHALMARYFGIPTRDITLYPIGGVARLERLSERPWEEFWIAVAGPAVNVAIAALLLIPVVPMVRLADQSIFGAGLLLPDLLLINVMLVLFNMLPAFPMDGGRVLRALLAKPLGYVRATEVAAALGTAFAILFALLALPVFHNPMLLLIAGFAYLAGQQELAMVRHRAFRRAAQPMDVVAVEDVIDVQPLGQQATFSGFTWDAPSHSWILWQNGRPVQAFRAD